MTYKRKYDFVDDFFYGFARVKLNGKTGAINKQCEEICEIKYDHIEKFENGFARVKLNDKRGVINEQGKEICPIKYDLIYDFQNGFAKVKLNDKWGVINEQGEEIIMGISYDKIMKYRHNFEKSEYYKEYLKKHGEKQKKSEVVSMTYKRKYDHIEGFENGYSKVTLNGKEGLINTEGKEICELKYDHVFDFENGFARVRINNNWGFINEQGEEVIMGLSYYETACFNFDFTKSEYYKEYLKGNTKKITKDLTEKEDTTKFKKDLNIKFNKVFNLYNFYVKELNDYNNKFRKNGWRLKNKLKTEIEFLKDFIEQYELTIDKSKKFHKTDYIDEKEKEIKTIIDNFVDKIDSEIDLLFDHYELYLDSSTNVLKYL